MRNVLLLLGALLPLVSAGVYMTSVVQGKSRPQRTTRLLMVVIGGLSFWALAAAHDHSGVLLALVSFVQAVAIWGLSFKRGIGGSGRLDFVCLGLCATGVVLWLACGQSLFGLCMSIIADVVACVPSFCKTVRLPHTESLAFYALDTVAGLCILLASARTLPALLYPAYIVLINSAFVLAIWWPRPRKSVGCELATP